MKYIYTLLTATLLLTACGGDKKSKSVEDLVASNNLEALIEKREEIDAKQLEFAAQLKLINDRISELDTVKKLPLVTSLLIESEKFDHFLVLQGNVKTKQ